MRSPADTRKKWHDSQQTRGSRYELQRKKGRSQFCQRSIKGSSRPGIENACNRYYGSPSTSRSICQETLQFLQLTSCGFYTKQPIHQQIPTALRISAVCEPSSLYITGKLPRDITSKPCHWELHQASSTLLHQTTVPFSWKLHQVSTSLLCDLSTCPQLGSYSQVMY